MIACTSSGTDARTRQFRCPNIARTFARLTLEMTTASDAVRSDLAHLYRRAGFGATPAELDAAVTAGYAATVAALVRPPSASDPGVLATPPPELTVAPPPGKDQTAAERKAYRAQVGSEGRAVSLWWLDRMVMATNPFPEKLTFFWHGHFATAISKVRSAALMLRQNELLRTQGLGAFDVLDLAIARDPAMMIWLTRTRTLLVAPTRILPREHGTLHARIRQLLRGRRERGRALLHRLALQPEH